MSYHIKKVPAGYGVTDRYGNMITKPEATKKLALLDLILLVAKDNNLNIYIDEETFQVFDLDPGA